MGDERRTRARQLLGYAVLALVLYRLVYHLTYLAEVPFALSTFSDGALYERAAFDIHDNPPLGTEVFYLQGAYAYLLALGLAIRPWISLGLILQIVLGLSALAVFWRATRNLWGDLAGTVSTLCLLAYPALAFYENKYLSAELGVVCNVYTFGAAVWMARTIDGDPGRLDWRRWLPALWLGACAGAAVLARTNLILALPFCAWACIRVAPKGRGLRVAAFCCGVALAVAPMAARNLVITGSPDLGPAHGGGTSFYIGNNPHSKGTWNAAGGLLTGNVTSERDELAAALDVEVPEQDHPEDGAVRSQARRQRALARAIGDEMYARAFRFLREQPGDAAVLLTRKVYRSAGNAEMAQDYDWAGERELLPWSPWFGVPFGVLLALFAFGVGRGFKPAEPLGGGGLETHGRAAVRWVLLGQAGAVVAALLVYFTSAQHRLPLAVIFAVWSGPALVEITHAIRSRAFSLTRRSVIGAVLVLQAFAPRPGNRREPHAVHYYNLGIVQKDIGDPLAALSSFDRAVEMQPEQAFFRLRRAQLLRFLSELDRAQNDLEHIVESNSAPPAIEEAARLELELLAIDRQMIAEGKLVPRAQREAERRAPQ